MVEERLIAPRLSHTLARVRLRSGAARSASSASAGSAVSGATAPRKAAPLACSAAIASGYSARSDASVSEQCSRQPLLPQATAPHCGPSARCARSDCRTLRTAQPRGPAAPSRPIANLVDAAIGLNERARRGSSAATDWRQLPAQRHGQTAKIVGALPGAKVVGV